MDDLAHSAPLEVAKRLRALAAGLTDAADIAAVNKYADELERNGPAQYRKVERPNVKGS
jgi:hypothetical protein